ncbi:unnamed protein product [Phytomonas sp. EM1]|nr:unnamed protein product [Phytomonas sp. EM1]|eukprot:CCW62390.1 unnamed protein product [Phytomonas sp. isolate EM1]
MVDLLHKITWKESGVLIPGTHSTEPDGTIPWKCISEIIPGLYLTCQCELHNKQKAMERGIALILNMCACNNMDSYTVYEFNEVQNIFLYREIKDLDQFVCELNEYTSHLSDKDLTKNKIFIHNIPAVDTPTYPIEKHFPLTCALIRLLMNNRTFLERNEIDWSYEQLHAVAVNCMVGVSRSASIVAAYLMKSAGITSDVALSFIQMVRPVVNPNVGFQRQLLLWEATSGQRIVDDFSARLVAFQIKNDVELLGYIRLHLPLLLKISKFSQERRYLGLVISLTQPSSETLALVYREVESNVTEAIVSEDYTDAPNFFVHVSEIVGSLQTYCADIFANLHVSDTMLVFNDSFYFKVLKDVACSGLMREIYDTVRAFCSILREVDMKHFSSNGSLSVSFPREVRDVEVPRDMVVSFPFLVFIAPYVEGFVQPEKLISLESEFCLRNNGRGLAKTEKLVEVIKNEFLDAFLIPFSNKDIDSSTASFEKGWQFNAPFHFLTNDLEVRVLETFRTNESIPFNILSSNLEKLPWNLGKILALKFVSGLFAFRLVLETIEQFLMRTCHNHLSKGVNLSERKLPLILIDKSIKYVEATYKKHYHKPCDIVSFLGKELQPLFEAGVIQADGLWSLVK